MLALLGILFRRLILFSKGTIANILCYLIPFSIIFKLSHIAHKKVAKIDIIIWYLYEPSIQMSKGGKIKQHSILDLHKKITSS